ncbi:MAG: sorbosone dehydrogenase family protein [Abitibacteriaceae bacterium]|nr:sorbosone dehydrogenase family protein [Abditibacteriaceae bacterium]MBV9863934.1 sorbosone dehydrogenase family protein [Abditibacteriaceae bacterium]
MLNYRILLTVGCSLLCSIAIAPVVAAPAPSAYHGQTYHIRPAELPLPHATRSVINVPKIIPQPKGVELKAPPGFRVSVFAAGLIHPRWLTVAPNGDVFCVESRVETNAVAQPHRVVLLRDSNGDGKAELRHTFTTDLNLPFGIAIHQNYLYVANTGSVVRWPYHDGQLQAEGAPEVVIKGLPERGYNQHWTRNILFAPSGKSLFVTIGSLNNIGIEEPRRAAISAYPLGPDGLPNGNPTLYATGLRNPVGLAFNPRTGALWATNNERDYLGDDLVPDFLTAIHPGGFYGWPYYYLGRYHNPGMPERPDLRRQVIVPDVLFQAHSSSLGLCFYTAHQFPASYWGDAFVALHGSQNRHRRTGYKIVRVRFDKSGKPVGGYEDFITGWMLGPDRKEVWGRPAGLALDRFGALLIADDAGQKIWRVTYQDRG